MLEYQNKGTSIILSERLVGQLKNPPQLPDVRLVSVVSSGSFFSNFPKAAVLHSHPVLSMMSQLWFQLEVFPFFPQLFVASHVWTTTCMSSRRAHSLYDGRPLPLSVGVQDNYKLFDFQWGWTTNRIHPVHYFQICWVTMWEEDKPTQTDFGL